MGKIRGLVQKYNKLVRRRGLAGLDTAIILIAFIITASVLAFVAINMGLFVTQKAKTTINKGEETASTALTVSSSVLYAVNYPSNTKSYWIYFTVSPTSGVSSVELDPATTGLSFIATEEGITLSNIYKYTLLTDTHLTPVSASGYSLTLESNLTSGGNTYYYFSSPYLALLALNQSLSKVSGHSPIYINYTSFSSTNPEPSWLKNDNNFTFTLTIAGQKVLYYVFINQTFAFSYPVAGDPLVGSAIAPAGSTVGFMILFGPNLGQHVFEYQTINIQITPNIGSPLTLSEYIYQPEGTVTAIG
ncbi:MULTISPECIES: archaellin/type IV pilin N-terminal domain-containing protein [Metallosphaera]|uniref:Flagellin n=2 Tax=Metallosphaera sedula TaxID=43687 RepID=A4YGD6_METS5|nr:MULTISPECIES: archaellin/type IV pilin N-terminal domain-containing protein [Metallosphaera]ABP95488.1 flagellin-like protein [Metallosphaera sedula DSM 5348]AIM27473.1 flagellin-like protein [Metallosphaera sedula]AKV74343.1 flagellin [Metallosphaera sedula]AKV76582.1 flagellin [Metallosphaera sedula]AKV78834.1 flagellin [Metallosphaera sedula]